MNRGTILALPPSVKIIIRGPAALDHYYERCIVPPQPWMDISHIQKRSITFG